MKKPIIITPVLKYWGFQVHPFDDNTLKGNDLRLFVGRETEIKRLHNALSSRLSGVYGSQGVGKSSFLRKFEDTIRKTGLDIVYVHMVGASEKALYREILAGLLQHLLSGAIKTNRSLKINVKDELLRVNSGIKIALGAEFGIDKVITAKISRGAEKQLEPHSEESARMLIRDIVTNTRTSFVVVIDDLERIQYFMQDDKAYLRFVSSFARTVDESFNDPSIAFTLSLDNHFIRLNAEEKKRGEGAFSFSFGRFIELKSFNPQTLANLMKRRLKDRNWGKTFLDFISVDAFWILITACNGHPRRSLAVLRNAMEFVAEDKKGKKLDATCMLEGLVRSEERVDEKDVAIVRFLDEHGPQSASDRNFQRAIDLGRATLLGRLKSLSEQIGLEITKKPVGKTAKDLYSLPSIDFSN